MILESIPPDLMAFATSFMFVFAIVFALLIYSQIFKESRYAVVVIAAVIGFIAAAYQPFSAVLQLFIPWAAGLLVVVFFLVFLRELFKREPGQKRNLWPVMVVLAISLLLLSATWPELAGYLGLGVRGTENVMWIVGIILIILIFWLALKEQTEGPTVQPQPGT
jgi:hypothetical protein